MDKSPLSRWERDREPCTVEAVTEEVRKLGPLLEETEGVGIFGSLLWPKFNERSDIDLFVVLPEEDYGDENQFRWLRLLSRPLRERFRRDVHVIFYTLRALKKVPDWYTILLASDHALIYDKGAVEPILRRIVAEAERVGLVRVWTHRNCPTWKMGRPLRFGEIIRVEVTDDDE